MSLEVVLRVYLGLSLMSFFSRRKGSIGFKTVSWIVGERTKDAIFSKSMWDWITCSPSRLMSLWFSKKSISSSVSGLFSADFYNSSYFSSMSFKERALVSYIFLSNSSSSFVLIFPAILNMADQAISFLSSTPRSPPSFCFFLRQWMCHHLWIYWAHLNSMSCLS